MAVEIAVHPRQDRLRNAPAPRDAFAVLARFRPVERFVPCKTCGVEAVYGKILRYVSSPRSDWAEVECYCKVHSELNPSVTVKRLYPYFAVVHTPEPSILRIRRLTREEAETVVRQDGAA